MNVMFSAVILLCAINNSCDERQAGVAPAPIPQLGSCIPLQPSIGGGEPKGRAFLFLCGRKT